MYEIHNFVVIYVNNLNYKFLILFLILFVGLIHIQLQIHVLLTK